MATGNISKDFLDLHPFILPECLKLFILWKCKYCSTTCWYLLFFNLICCWVITTVLYLIITWTFFFFFEKVSSNAMAEKAFFSSTCHVLLLQNMFCLILIIASGRTGGHPSLFWNTASRSRFWDGWWVNLKPS